MPRKAAGIQPINVKRLPPGRYGDGAGLYLLVRPPGARQTEVGEKDAGRFWLFRYRVDGRMREMGLGSADGKGSVSLKEARLKAADLNAVVKNGIDPLAKRDEEEAARKAATIAALAKSKTFREVAALYVAAHEAGWRNEKHRDQWIRTLETYAYPHMGNAPVGDVTTAHVMAALEPIWRVTPETATRVRGRIEAVLNYAKARGWRDGENPALWRGHLANLLPARSKIARVQHHAALPWQGIAPFMTKVRQQTSLAAHALELTILTAARSGEVLGANWGEFDLETGLWIVPAERMKAGREHRIPLSGPTLVLLKKLLPLRRREEGDWLFPGNRKGRPLSNMSMEMLLRRMKRDDITVHGMRSTFRDWVAEATNHAREVAEMALAHTLSDKVEAAYRRGDLMEKRRRLMEEWGAFCDGAGAEADNS